MVIAEDKPEVKEVKRDKNGKALLAVIECGPFRMEFSPKGKKRKVSLVAFARFDNSQDEPDWIPGFYFEPAIDIARGIFSSSQKKKTSLLQARLAL